MTRLVWVAAIAVAFAELACGRGTQPTPSVAPSPTRPAPVASTVLPAPSPTLPATRAPVRPLPTPTPALSLTAPLMPTTPASPTPTTPPLTPIEVAIAACQAAPPGSFVGGAGTIPGPTPTPEPTPAPRPAEEIERAVKSYAELIGPITRAVSRWTTETERGWPGAVPLLQAELLRVESPRLAALCTATSAIVPDYVLREAHGRWAAALHARQQWASEAAHALGCCGTAATPEADALRKATAAQIEAAVVSLASSVAGYGGGFSVHAGYQIEGSRLAIGVSVPAGWIVGRNDTQVALIAPNQLQLASREGLGVDGSSLGTGVRIRRLRKQAGWTLASAVDQAKTALVGLGQETRRRELAVGGQGAVELVLEAPGASWTTRVVVVGARDYAYFIELGCPALLADPCGPAFDSVLAGLTFKSS